ALTHRPGEGEVLIAHARVRPPRERKDRQGDVQACTIVYPDRAVRVAPGHEELARALTEALQGAQFGAPLAYVRYRDETGEVGTWPVMPKMTSDRDAEVIEYEPPQAAIARFLATEEGKAITGVVDALDDAQTGAMLVEVMPAETVFVGKD